jgi:protein-S-isoprenylcysteine O-methyltransferase Ste14
MESTTVFRVLFTLSALAMMAVRLYYQSKILPERDRTMVTGSSWRLIPGAVAALVTLVFGFEYIFLPGAFPWAYGLYPSWLRWLGAFLLVWGIALLGWAHHHLGKSFHSLVVRKADQVLVESGPYRTIRPPIYTAFALSYIGGGLLASNIVLTLIPGLLFGLMIALRIEEEETAMLAQFGAKYHEYMRRTGRFMPPLRRQSRTKPPPDR